MQAGLSTKNAPSIWVVAPHFILAPVSFLLASLYLLANYGALLGYHIDAPVLTVLHLMILGWVSMIIFGALYQLIPVVMEVKLFSETLAYITLAGLASGLFFLIAAFMGYNFQLTNNFIIGGSLIIGAVLIFTVNTFVTALRSEKKNISKLYIVSSAIYLLLTVMMGLFIVLNLKYAWLSQAHTEFLKTHIVIGLVGWFLMLVIGVAATLMPMFLIVHKIREDYLRWGFYLIHAGVITIFTITFIPAVPEFVSIVAYLLILAGLVLFLMFNYDVFSHRMRKKLDIGMKLSAVALIVFALSVVSFILVYFGNGVLGFPVGRIEIIAGILLVYGFFTGLILGQTYKTLPFIIWLFHYQKLVGKQKTPLPDNLYSDKLATIHMYSFVISLVLFMTGLLFSVKLLLLLAVIAMIFTSLVYSVNVYRMIFHKKQNIK
jgi:hypothetical protein